MKYLFFIILLNAFSTVWSEEIIIKENSTYTLGLKLVNNGTGEKYILDIERLILNDNSILFVPELPNKEVIINVGELIVNGKAVIVQTFSNNFKFDYLNTSTFDFYWKQQLPVGRDVKNGAPVTPAKRPTGDKYKGTRGNDGEEGSVGRNSISKLILNINIVRLEQLHVLLIAESGGKGGNGSMGQIGSDAECSRNAGGDGGDGGSGGNGGAPGNSGDIIINWTSNNNIKLIGKTPMGLFAKSMPGMVGLPGAGGDGAAGGDGKGCFPLYTRSAGSSGTPGSLGPARNGNNEYVYFGNKGKTEINHKGEL